MRRIVSILLAVCILLSLSVGIFAIKVTPTVSPASIKAGEDVKVTLTLDETKTDLRTLGYNLYYDKDLFTYKSATTARFWDVVDMTATEGTGVCQVVFAVTDASNPGTVTAGEIATLTFTAKSDVTEEQAAAFRLVLDTCYDKSWSEVPATAGDDVTVKVTPSSASDYSIGIKAASATANVNDTVTYNVTVASGTKTTYNSADITIEYPTDKLSYASSSLGSDGVKITDDKNGSLTIRAFGANRATGTPFTLSFTAKATGDAAVTIKSAAIDEKANAGTDAPAATIAPASATVKISQEYNVTLPDFFDGAATVKHGDDYTFTPKDTNLYDYDLPTATMGGTATTVIKNTSGSYTIKNVTGDLVIKGTRTAKSFSVTVDGTGKADVTAAATATYGEGYTFAVKQDEKYTYTVAAKIGSTDLALTSDSNGNYTIAGKDITGDITITVTKTVKPVEKTDIEFTGTGAADVKGGTTQQAENGKEFTFELNAESGYDYTVTLDGEKLTAVNGKYTIPAAKITGTKLVVMVEKTAHREVEVTEYVKVNNTSIWLVTVTGTVDQTKALQYDGANMFWSEKYNGYAYLVFSADTLETVKAAAKAAITEGSETPTTIAYTGDVNKTGKTDINDAQATWNMYNAEYSAFATASGFPTMEHFLRADMNGDRVLNVKDATAIVDKLG